MHYHIHALFDTSNDTPYLDGLLHMVPSLNKYTDSGGAAALHSACLLGHTQVMLNKRLVVRLERKGERDEVKGGERTRDGEMRR